MHAAQTHIPELQQHINSQDSLWINNKQKKKQMNQDRDQLCWAFVCSISAHAAHIHSESSYLSYSVSTNIHHCDSLTLAPLQSVEIHHGYNNTVFRFSNFAVKSGLSGTVLVLLSKPRQRDHSLPATLSLSLRPFSLYIQNTSLFFSWSS